MTNFCHHCYLQLQLGKRQPLVSGNTHQGTQVFRGKGEITHTPYSQMSHENTQTQREWQSQCGKM